MSERHASATATMLADELERYPRLGLFPGGRLMLPEETDFIVLALRSYAGSITQSAAASTTRERINALLKRLVEDNYEENRIAAANAIGDILDSTLQSATGPIEEMGISMERMALTSARDYLLWLTQLKGVKEGAYESVLRMIDRGLNAPADSETNR